MAEPLSSQVWVAAWLQKANHDLETAEKSLKAFLASRLEPLLKTHDLMDLLTRCAAADARFAEWADRIAELSAFGTVLTYPSVDADPAVSDVTHALQTAQQFHGFVSAILGDRLPIKWPVGLHRKLPSSPA